MTDALLRLLPQMPWQIHKDERKGTGLPPIYTTWSGRQFVKAGELIRSEVGRRTIRRSNRMMKATYETS